ncbi:DUF1045 domain-containing protein [Tropicimonas sp. S265A]|uniref:DUF1045 domain-containing protein n=1 Tax=Tropicimonas sp. S265A TaxID=3415134 RepID=UPI003C7E5400
MKYARFSICITPDPDSDLARLGKHWLGWDIDQAVELPFLKVDNLKVSALSLTARVRRFGFHALLAPPFRLANGHSPLDLHHTAQALAAHLEALEFPGLYLSAEDDQLALRPMGDLAPLHRLQHIADQVFDEYRAPPPPDAAPQPRRRSELSAQQMQVVIGESLDPTKSERPFEFVLTEPRPRAEVTQLRQKLLPILSPNLPRPFHVQSITLCGEDQSGWFRVIQRYPLTGGLRTRAPDAPRLHTLVPQVPL